MDFNDAAAFQIAYGTSHLALEYKAKVKPGETILVLGASGGVGWPYARKVDGRSGYRHCTRHKQNGNS